MRRLLAAALLALSGPAVASAPPGSPGAIGLLNGYNSWSGANVFGAGISIDGSTAGNRIITFSTTGAGSRWLEYATSTAESGGNAGSDLCFQRRDDTGTQIDNPLCITRSTGRLTILDGMTLSGSMSGASASFSSTLAASGITTTNNLIVSSTVIGNRQIQFQTSGSLRFYAGLTATAESGSNVGSDFNIVRRDDSGAGLGTSLLITRSTGLVSFPDTAGISVAAGITLSPPASVTPASNGQCTFQLTSNTALAIKCKGSDGTVRTGTVTLS